MKRGLYAAIAIILLIAAGFVYYIITDIKRDEARNYHPYQR